MASRLDMGKATMPAIAIILFQYVNIGRPQDIFMSIRSIYPGIITVIICLITSIVYWKSVQGPPLQDSLTFRRFRNLVILMIIVIPFSVVPPKALNYMFNEFSFYLVYFVCFCHFIRSFNEVRLSLLVMIFSSFSLALSMILQDSQRGRLSTGTMYDPNDIALLFVAIIPIAVYYTKYSQGWIRILSALTVIISMVAIALTQSRGAFLGLVILISLWFFQQTSYVNSKELKKKVLIFLAIFMVVLIFFPQAFWDRMGTIFQEGDTGSGRLTVWPRAIQMMVWHPQGVGPGSFTTVYGRYLSNNRFAETTDIARERAWMTAHNSYLLVGTELGFIGLTLYMIWLIGMLKTTSKLKRIIKDNQINDMLFQHCSMVQLSLIGFMIPAFFLSQSFSFILLTVSGYVVSLERIVSSELNTCLQSSL